MNAIAQAAISPSWTPDSKQLVFAAGDAGGYAIYRINVDGSGLQHIGNDTAYDSSPAVSPDGTKIAMTRGTDPNGTADIYVMNADGTGLTPVTTSADEEDTPAWTPDSQQLVYDRIYQGKRVIFLTNADGTNQHQLTVPDQRDSHATVSADGKLVVFSCRQPMYGQADLCETDLAGSFRINLTNSNGLDGFGFDLASFQAPGSVGTPPTTTTTTTAPPTTTTTAPPPTGRYVALGDSYSSGEGNPPFLDGTDTTTNRCHRSKHGFALLLHPSGLTTDLFACSGATTQDFYGPNTEGNQQEPAQLTHLNFDPAIKLVTVSIGGNDLGFPDVLRQCADLGDCSRDRQLNAAISARVRALRNILPNLYREIGRQAPNARVVVVNYPSLFNRTPSNTCSVISLTSAGGEVKIGWTAREQRYLNSWGLILNGVVRSSIADAKKLGPNKNIALADAYKAFGDHGVCSTDEWINAPTIFTTDSPLIFHPNIVGQLADVTAVRLVTS